LARSAPPDTGGMSWTLSAKASLSAAKAAGLPFVGSADDIRLEAAYADGAVTFSGGHARMLGADIAAAGLFKDTTIRATLTGALPLPEVTRFLTGRLALPGHEISGTAETRVDIERAFAEGAATRVSGEMALHDLWLRLKEKDVVVSAESGALRFDIPAEKLSWDFGELRYGDASYNVSGTLAGFRQPHVVADVDGPAISLHADAVLEDPQVVFNECFGRWHDSVFRFKGTWKKEDDTAAIEAEAVVELADLAYLPEPAQAAARKVPGRGPCRLSLRLDGPLRRPSLWTVHAKAASDAVRLAGYYIEDVAIDYEQADRQCRVTQAVFRAYNGEGYGQARVDLTPDIPSFALRATLENLDLNRLKIDTPLKGRTFFGILSGNTSLQGTLGEPQTFSGGGHLSIKDGNLWEFNPMRGLGTFLFIPRFTNIVFDKAQGDYFVREGHIETQNLQLIAPELTLLIEGEMEFAGGLDLLVTTQMPLGPAGNVEEVSQAVGALTKAGSLTAIHVTGTVQEPKYKLLNAGANIVKKFTDIFSNIFSGPSSNTAP
ncbi:MAG: AsmA-like C-terminal region-containing protein, partial [Deltaproteobacteria bacterium]